MPDKVDSRAIGNAAPLTRTHMSSAIDGTSREFNLHPLVAILDAAHGAGAVSAICRLSDGRGRHPSANAPRDFTAHCATTAAATTSMRPSMACMQVQLTGAVRPNAGENGQISRSTAVWAP